MTFPKKIKAKAKALSRIYETNFNLPYPETPIETLIEKWVLLDDVLTCYAEDQKERKQKLQQLKIFTGKIALSHLPLQNFVLVEDLRKIIEEV